MRTGPGGGGSSTSERVNVSYRRIAGDRSQAARLSASSRESAASDGRELGPALGAGQRQTEGAQVATDRLELADDRLALLEREPLRRRSPELDEPHERRARASSPSATSAGATTRRAYSRASTRLRAPRSAGTTSSGASAAAASSSSGMAAIASTASRRSRARSSWTSCSGRSSSSRYARTAAAGKPSSRSSAIEEWPWRFDSFFPSGPSTSPWWITSGSSPPSARAMPLLHGEVRAVIRAANHVRDAERRGRPRRTRAGTSPFRPSGAASCRRGRAAPSRPRRAPLHPSASARSTASAYTSPRSLCRTGPSSKPTPSHARSARIASSPPSTLRAGSVSSIRSTTTPPWESAKRRFATAVSAFPRWSEPVGLGAKRTRTDTRLRVDRDVARLRGDALEPRARRRVRRRGRSRPRARRACTRRARCPRASSARRRRTSRPSRPRSIASSAAYPPFIRAGSSASKRSGVPE